MGRGARRTLGTASARRPRARLWLGSLVCAAASLGACASDLTAVPGGYRHSGHGYRISDPPSGSGVPWEPADIEGTALAYRRAGPQVMSLQSRCNRPVAKPAVMARQLLIGLDPRIVEQAGPVTHAGAPGWVQIFETPLEGRRVRVKTVTLVESGCSYDWVLTVTGAFEEAERDFDRWWGSFRLDANASGADAAP